MAKLTQTLNLKTGQGASYAFTHPANYTEVINKTQILDNSDAFITVLETSDTLSADKVTGMKPVVLKNRGPAGIEVQIKTDEFKNNSNSRAELFAASCDIEESSK